MLVAVPIDHPRGTMNELVVERVAGDWLKKIHFVSHERTYTSFDCISHHIYREGLSHGEICIVEMDSFPHYSSNDKSFYF